MVWCIWLMLTITLAALLYFVRRSIRSREQKLSDRILTVSKTSVPLELAPRSFWAQTRIIERISVGEFITIHERCKDLIVIDLRTNAEHIPYPVSTAFVLPVAPKDLISVLDRLPASRTLVLYGASALSIFMIDTTPCEAGSAPLYILEGDIGCDEVA